MGEMIPFTPKELQIIGQEEKEGQKVEEKIDFSIQFEKSRQELHREKVARPRENEKMIVIDDGS